MDLLDKSIIFELMKNSRISCEEIAGKHNSTRGVVRKRINKLVERGIIHEFSAWYSLAMIDAEFVFGHVKILQQREKEDLFKELIRHPMIYVVIPLATGDVIFHANVVGTEGLSELGSHIRKLENVDELELHLIQSDRGRKVELKRTHLHVLSALFENSRISIAEIARKTSLSPRRVKRALDEIVSGEGVVFAIARNPALSSGISFYAKIKWNERETNAKKLIGWIEKEFPVETWESYISASESVFFTRFFVEHIKDVEKISNSLSGFSEVKIIEILVFYPARISSIPTRDRLGEDIIKAGFDVSYS
ncbi:MAG: winged helix-turn-helix transcriptional regulator [Candidatus Thorarchaeota archaeon]